MANEIKNRKSKKKSGDHDKYKEKSEESFQSKLIDDTDCLTDHKFGKTNRDSGDGDSAPETPPREFEDEKVLSDSDDVSSSITKKKSKVKSSHSARSEAKSSPKSEPFKLHLDGFSFSLFVLSFATRVWKLESPKGVVFDELHYGKYAGLYMQNTFFFDSQPPLGKQIIALAAYIAGFDGNFKFERIGTAYDSTVPVAAMRLVPAFFGSLLMPTIYALMTELGVSHYAGALAAFLLIFDNAVLAQSRFILMESILIFFGVFGLYCVLRFRRYYSRPYSLPWFTFLGLGALSLAASFCVRYFGIFTFFLGIGILTKDFWVLVGDRRISDLRLLGHFITRGIVFISIPVALYVGVFYLHLNLLYKAGPNDNIMTSGFQASLEGGLAAIIANQPVKILHGSQITLRHTHGRTCWLHSHDEVYPVKYADDRGSSHQQQVTCYSYKDVNNWWIIKKPDMEELVVSEPHVPIVHGDVVQIVHGLTSRALNSHDVAAAMSPHTQEVTCYIDYNVSMPAQNLWRIDILNKDSTDNHWHAVESHVRLIHVNTSSAMKFSGRQYPDWGFRQHEVVADKVVEQEDTIWNVEEHRYSRTEDKKEREKELISQEMIPTERRNLTFWDKLYELQYKMLFNNQENVAGHMYASDPLDWLSLKRGVAYWISPTSNAQVHYIGNIIVWLSGTLSLVAYLALFTWYLLRRQRACYDIPEADWLTFCNFGEVLMAGFLINFIPYFLVERTLFLHHYMPAYVFKICLLAAMVDHVYFLISKCLKWRFLSMIYLTFVALWMLSVIYVFTKFAPVTYGDVDLTPDQISNLSWRDTWDLIVHKQQ